MVEREFGPEAARAWARLNGAAGIMEADLGPGVDRATKQEIFRWFSAMVKQMNTAAEEAKAAGQMELASARAHLAMDVTGRVLGLTHRFAIKAVEYAIEVELASQRLDRAAPLFDRLIDAYAAKYGPLTERLAEVIEKKVLPVYIAARSPRDIERTYERLLEIQTGAHGPESTQAADVVLALGVFYDQQGASDRAEEMFGRGIKLASAAYGPDHPATAHGINNLALLYYASNRVAEAEPMFKRALTIYEMAYTGDHPALSNAMNNLALLYSATGRMAEAEEYFRRALDMDERIYGPESEHLLTPLNNMATLMKDMGRLDEARILYERAIAIGEAQAGASRAALGANLNNLGLIHFDQGALDKAEGLFERAVAIGLKSLGQDSPEFAAWKGNLALLYAATGRAREAFGLFREVLALEQAHREDVFVYLPEGRKLEYMQRAEGSVSAFISLVAESLPDDREAARAAFDVWLRWKGAVLESQQRYMDIAMQSADTRVQAQFEELKRIRQEIARVKLGGTAGGTLAAYRMKISTLEGRKDRIEAELSGLNREFALQQSSTGADARAIARVLPDGSVYLDYAYISTYDFKGREGGAFEYYAFVLAPAPTPGGEPVVRLRKLPESAEINKRIAAYLDEIRSPLTFGSLPRESVLKPLAQSLFADLVQPFAGTIGSRRTLFVSPGGNLNLLPFEVLQDSDGRYMVERYRLSYVTAGRDMMRFGRDRASMPDAVVIADPDYEMHGQAAAAGATALTRESAALSFVPLPDTRDEAEAVGSVLHDSLGLRVRTHLGTDATEDKLFGVDSPRFLHIATHAFFLTDQAYTAVSGKGSDAAENPMLRSGIVLAGANPSLAGGSDYGVVSAYRALTLKLSGTEMVVLSACDTGTGEVQRGEGVFGLRRAFIVAGARTLVMSLWSVPSHETMQMMTGFYQALAKGMGKADALRAARLALMQERTNPFFWGAFVMAGDPD